MKFIIVTSNGSEWCINTANIVAVNNHSGKAAIYLVPSNSLYALTVDQTYEEVIKLLRE